MSKGEQFRGMYFRDWVFLWHRLEQNFIAWHREQVISPGAFLHPTQVTAIPSTLDRINWMGRLGGRAGGCLLALNSFWFLRTSGIPSGPSFGIGRFFISCPEKG